MKSLAVEAIRVLAQGRRTDRTAGGQERQVAGARHRMELGMLAQAFAHRTASVRFSRFIAFPQEYMGKLASSLSMAQALSDAYARAAGPPRIMRPPRP